MKLPMQSLMNNACRCGVRSECTGRPASPLTPHPSPPLSGDIVLCAPVIAREAKAQAKPLADHCAHLLVHGLLHLQGHDHEREEEAVAMQAVESFILRRLGVPDPYPP